MLSFTTHTGTITPLYRSNIDTDQIIPKQFLKRIERTGYGEFLFYDWRYNADGSPVSDFELNDPRFRGSTILVTGPNFGCGSSREHAPWSLVDHGFRVIIAPSFADIFYNNCLKNGLLPVVADVSLVKSLIEVCLQDPTAVLTVDLPAQTVSDRSGVLLNFDIDPFRKYCMVNGLDDIALTMRFEDKISAYEQNAEAGSRFISYQ